jgi:hypothetical protein
MTILQYLGFYPEREGYRLTLTNRESRYVKIKIFLQYYKGVKKRMIFKACHS